MSETNTGGIPNVADMSPTYQPLDYADFVGPLRLVEGFTDFSDIKGKGYIFFDHPTDYSSKLVRKQPRDLSFESKAEMDESVLKTQTVLAGLAAYGVAHVNPVFSDITADGVPEYIMVVDRLSNGAQNIVYDVIQKNAITLEMVPAFDQFFGGMLSYMIDANKDPNVPIDLEIMAPYQAGYDPDKNEVAIIDVESHSAYVCDEAELIATELIGNLLDMAEQTEQPLRSLHMALKVIDTASYPFEYREAVVEEIIKREMDELYTISVNPIASN